MKRAFRQWDLLYGTDLNSVNSFCDVIFSLMRKICYTQYISYKKTRKNLPNTPPHDICIFMCRYREMYYWFTATSFLLFTLASRGLEELFFQLCCCVSFWFWREIGFGFTYLHTLLSNFFWNLNFPNSC